MDNGIG